MVILKQFRTTVTFQFFPQGSPIAPAQSIPSSPLSPASSNFKSSPLSPASPTSSSDDDDAKREAQWRSMKLGFSVIGASTGALLAYFIYQYGKCFVNSTSPPLFFNTATDSKLNLVQFFNACLVPCAVYSFYSSMCSPHILRVHLFNTWECG